jgi:hypothetical protein
VRLHQAIGTVEAVRALTIARNSAVEAITTASNQVEALLVGSPGPARPDARPEPAPARDPGPARLQSAEDERVVTLTGNSARQVIYGVGGYDEAKPAAVTTRPASRRLWSRTSYGGLNECGTATRR